MYIVSMQRLRRAYATTAGQIGQLYCDVLSMTTVHDPLKTEKIVKNLIAVRMKLNRTRALRRNVAYEVSGEGFFLWFDIWKKKNGIKEGEEEADFGFFVVLVARGVAIG